MIVEGFGRCLPVEGFAGKAVERGCDGLEVARLCLPRSVPFGKHWRRRPLVFSLVPHCHGLLSSFL
jgi:hypothetical protein